ncbi:MAG: type III-B CRISPR module-associated protein Cmr5 [Thermogutta sp.]|uniref:type III-B CRISPR module-associated protein Cmr5 n=1 Tax=Thermogutta sp. TaxID=1962930 RepID=UPI00198D2A9A|nr:type III-B CRISPR module-associated protein Cmr5 [Thermogutta sp.]MBC7350996.1 type III-B CRISPR module-associated protein Cmr5 [Thermogutta sp.]
MTNATKADRKTLDQRRAEHAWQAVQAAKNNKDVDFEKFHGQAKKLPVRIIASGLGQALAFLKAKNYAPKLLVALGDWVLDKRVNPDSKKPEPDDMALLKAVVEGDAEFLRWATDEVLAYLQWLVRFADAEKPEDDQSTD